MIFVTYEITKEDFEEAQKYGAKYIITANDVDMIEDAKVEESDGRYYLTYRRSKKV